jgi:hypothetical protein
MPFRDALVIYDKLIKFIRKLFMPKKRQHYEILQNEVLNLISKRDKFLELYGKQESVDVLNSIAAHCFGYIQVIFNDSIILSLTKLLDSSNTGGSKNLVLETLIDDIEDLETKNKSCELLIEIKELSSKYKKQRNKFIAHVDYKLKMKEPSQYLPIDINELDKIIEKIKQFMNIVETFHGYAIATYDITYDAGANCDILFHQLKTISIPNSGN